MTEYRTRNCRMSKENGDTHFKRHQNSPTEPKENFIIQNGLFDLQLIEEQGECAL